MDFIFPILAEIGESIAKTLDKYTYNSTRALYRYMLWLNFAVMSIVAIVYLIITKQPFPHLTGLAILYVILIGLFSFGGNVFDEISLRSDDLSLREPLVDFEPILAGLIAYILFPAERKVIYLVAFLIGAAVVLWSSRKARIDKKQRKGLLYLFIAGILYGFLPSLFKITLPLLSPGYIVLFRVVIIFILLSIFLTPKLPKKKRIKQTSLGVASGVIYGVEAILGVIAIQKLGVVVTMLVFMLGPALRYVTSSHFLKEKVTRAEVTASILLVLVSGISIIK